MPDLDAATPAPLDAAARDALARAFLPSRWDYHYARSKLSSDPLYDGVAGALAGSRGPLLDLGCGLGLLAHHLSAVGLDLAYSGVDNDAGKIARATTAAGNAGLRQAHFDCIDLSRGLPAHSGSVTILDVLQFLPPEAQQPLLREAARRVAPGGRLVIRTGLAGTCWRARVTRGVDVLSRAIGWMNAGPRRYPERAQLESLLAREGLSTRFQPLWGRTPFNNWLVVASR
ncbi:class I SAM-dependent methyltransferase [Alkalisalibacterium limincola]|uniref:Class I SAM-dependent methyltransferase n=1 Tax=Alkalisalibacterium limincola TaxID=2699169 RepID=A0A5C8KMP7_9GAMM|nr:class I SAM-dependent methyltransferase [Alkalisalibacterium limincola]TXK60489.1 class I SAM-dependent methyltransferase [Alkalisalibacterium limincola]